MLDFFKIRIPWRYPQPVFNTKWYSGSDSYSDGDVEETILKIIAQNNSTDYSEAITRNFHTLFLPSYALQAKYLELVCISGKFRYS